MSQMTLAMFIRERIIAALNVRDARDATDPVDAIFPRRQRGGSVHEIHRYRRKAGEVRMVGPDSKSIRARRGSFEIIRVEPLWVKLFEGLTGTDLILFDRGLRMTAAGLTDPGLENDVDARADFIARNLLEDANAQRRMLCRDALRDGVSFRMAGMSADQTTSFALNTLTNPGTAWSDTTNADPVSDVMGWISEFADNNDYGFPPDTGFISEDLYRTYIWPNANVNAYVDDGSALASAHIGALGPMLSLGDVMGEMPRWLGIRWIVFHGTYNDLTDTAQDKWPLDQITFAKLQGGGQSVEAEWQMPYDSLYTQNTGSWRFELEELDSDGVKGFKGHLYDNGCPMFNEPQLIQRVADLTP